MAVIRAILTFSVLSLAIGVCRDLSAQTFQTSEPMSMAEQLEFFERNIRPLLSQHCYECHSTRAERVEGNLLLDSRAAHLKGGDSGAAIIPGDTSGSLLLESVRY
ncbi:MAG: c-type cytochrome domain-containing protein, partial [Planctomycetota bacterium]